MAQKFEDLICWQEAIDLAVAIYKLTEAFPSKEQFGLTNQLRRAASSISANLAEGFGRHTSKDKNQFYSVAYGSLLEVKSFVYLATKLGYLQEDVSPGILNKITLLQKRINAFKKAVSHA